MLINSKICLNYFADVKQIEIQLERLRNEGKGRFGMVSSELPLLSNLSLKQNCALILQYHRHFSTRTALNEADSLLALFGLRHKGDFHCSHLDERDIFIGKLIRAVLFEQAYVVVDRPSEQLHADYEMNDIIAMIDKLSRYFAACNILEYQWEEERHGLRRG
jgi:ABC-type lipoprotein export system ATPase subunit